MQTSGGTNRIVVRRFDGGAWADLGPAFTGVAAQPMRLLVDATGRPVLALMRGFFVEVAHPELGKSFIYPGPAAIYSRSPWRISRRAPLIGEHNIEIFCDELGVSRAELAVLAESGVV